jgi:hypothetical protein
VEQHLHQRQERGARLAHHTGVISSRRLAKSPVRPTQRATGSASMRTATSGGSGEKCRPRPRA